jgi:tetratricopeptide (TPR) repeat protein
MVMEKVAGLAREARGHGLSGDFAAGHALLDEAAANAGEDADALAVIAIERGRLFHSAGSAAEALPFFETSWKLAQQANDHDLAVDAAHMMAIASPLPAAADWTRKALAYMDLNSASSFWRPMLHHNLGWTYFEAGRFEQALASFIREERLRKQSGSPQALKISRYAVVRTLRALGQFEEAIDIGEMAVALADQVNDPAPFLYEEMAECHAANGNQERSQYFARRAHEALSGDAAFARKEPLRLVRLSELAASEASPENE